jgi:meiosis-specific APC/C activator protein AMA1
VLDAPKLRDDFYCTAMAYSATCQTLVVGLGNDMYAWSELTEVSLLNKGSGRDAFPVWLTSMSFSSAHGGKSILAFGRSDGSLGFISLFDSLLPRFVRHHAQPIACVSWRPVSVARPSVNPRNSGMLVETEDLIVGEEGGDVYYYVVEWPDA